MSEAEVGAAREAWQKHVETCATCLKGEVCGKRGDLFTAYMAKLAKLWGVESEGTP